MQSAGFMRRSGAGSGGCCRRRRSRRLSFSIHFGLCGASGVGKWGRAAFRGGKAAFLSSFRDYICLWMPGSLPEAGISGGADSGFYPCEPPALPDLFDASVFLPGAAGVRKLLPPWWYLSGIFGFKSAYP